MRAVGGIIGFQIAGRGMGLWLVDPYDSGSIKLIMAACAIIGSGTAILTGIRFWYSKD